MPQNILSERSSSLGPVQEETIERSDVDIAVYGGDFDSFYWDIKENIHSLLMFDVINADASISEELKKEIKKDGVVIYEKA